MSEEKQRGERLYKMAEREITQEGIKSVTSHSCKWENTS